ncbi:MAG: endogenous inhibitor of DNA gyrase (YacG/DUF329 family) [Bacteriovoracaceae bacterium]|jgi:endogenous inhibitor of DNA gyrase (YacG/DUF329 family)
MKKNLEVKCPHCEKKFNYYEGKFRPFCTERCQMIDLGHWFDESYAVPTKEALSEEDIDEVVKKLESETE